MSADHGSRRASDRTLPVDAVGRVSLRLYRLGTQAIPGRFCTEAVKLIAESASLVGLRWYYGKRSNPALLASFGQRTESPRTLRIRVHEFLVDGDVGRTVTRLLPHAVNAWAVNQRTHGLIALPRPGSTDRSGSGGHALVDAHGVLTEADARFTELLGDEHGAVGRRLPFAIPWSDRVREHGLLYRGIHMTVSQRGRGYHLYGKPDQREDLLTRREWEVVGEVSRGRTYSQVGESLSMSASTVATHVHSVYQKLGIARRDALVDWLSGQALRVPDED